MGIKPTLGVVQKYPVYSEKYWPRYTVWVIRTAEQKKIVHKTYRVIDEWIMKEIFPKGEIWTTPSKERFLHTGLPINATDDSTCWQGYFVEDAGILHKVTVAFTKVQLKRGEI